MNDNAVGGGKCTPFSFNINGRKLTIIEIKGVLYFIAKEVGLFLDYSENGGRLATKITQVWSKPNKEGDVEMREGAHWILLEGEMLAAVKKVVDDEGPTRSLVDGDIRPNRSDVDRTARLLLLTEVGLNRVLLLTHKAAGRRLRDRLDSDILPQLHRTGAYLPEEKRKELEAALKQVEELKKQVPRQIEAKQGRKPLVSQIPSVPHPAGVRQAIINEVADLSADDQTRVLWLLESLRMRAKIGPRPNMAGSTRFGLLMTMCLYLLDYDDIEFLEQVTAIETEWERVFEWEGKPKKGAKRAVAQRAGLPAVQR